MRKLLLVLGMIWVVVMGYSQQFLYDSLQHDGLTRYYYLYVPSIYDGSEEVPLLFNLHGYSSNAGQQNFYGDFKPIADTANFIMCLPEGTFDLSNNQFWNSGFTVGGVDDVGFINSLIAKLESVYAIKGEQIYSCGMSNGGFMSLTLACELSEKITAVASVTGTMRQTQADDCNNVRPVPMMQIHGTDDANVPYAGAFGNLGIEALVDFWVDENMCSTEADTAVVPDIDPTDGCTAERYDYTSCDEGTEVVFYKIDGGAHTWPGAPINVGVTNQDFSASEVIWDFFRKFEHPTFTSISDTDEIEWSFSVTGNSIFVDMQEEIQSIDLYDLNGKRVGHSSTLNTLSLNGLQNGMYIISISTESRVVAEKFIF